jgi:hypothetical protein
VNNVTIFIAIIIRVGAKLLSVMPRIPYYKLCTEMLEFKYSLRFHQRGCRGDVYALVRFCVAVHTVCATPVSCAQVSRSVLQCSPACRVLQILEGYIFVNTTEHNRDRVPGPLCFEVK